MSELKSSLGSLYLQQTKFNAENLRNRVRPQIQAAEPFKTYPDAPRIKLPSDLGKHSANLFAVLNNRRSERRYGSHAMEFEHLALLLWSAQGITARAGTYLLRTAPSAGALYPVETYLGILNVDGIEPGIYHFNVVDFCLEQLSIGEPGKALAEAGLGQRFIAESAVTFIWSAVLRRNMAKYGHRGLRYIFMDAGHICQNVLLAAEALDLAACPIAAFFDDDLNSQLGLEGTEESAIYLATVGCRQ